MDERTVTGPTRDASNTAATERAARARPRASRRTRLAFSGRAHSASASNAVSDTLSIFVKAMDSSRYHTDDMCSVCTLYYTVTCAHFARLITTV